MGNLAVHQAPLRELGRHGVYRVAYITDPNQCLEPGYVKLGAHLEEAWTYSHKDIDSCQYLLRNRIVRFVPPSLSPETPLTNMSLLAGAEKFGGSNYDVATEPIFFLGKATINRKPCIEALQELMGGRLIVGVPVWGDDTFAHVLQKHTFFLNIHRQCTDDKSELEFFRLSQLLPFGAQVISTLSDQQDMAEVYKAVTFVNNLSDVPLAMETIMRNTMASSGLNWRLELAKHTSRLHLLTPSEIFTRYGIEEAIGRAIAGNESSHWCSNASAQHVMEFCPPGWCVVKHIHEAQLSEELAPADSIGATTKNPAFKANEATVFLTEVSSEKTIFTKQLNISPDLRPQDPCASMHAVGEPAPLTTAQLVLVTEGSAFIGSSLVELLLSLNFTVRIIDTFSAGDAGSIPLLSHPRVEVYYGDILEKDVCQKAVSGVVGVFHLTSAVSVKKPPTIRNAQSEGAMNLLEAAAAAGVKTFVYAVSSNFNRSHAKQHRENVEFSDKSIDDLSRISGLKTIILRIFSVYGPRQPSQGPQAPVLGNFSNCAAKNKSIVIDGSGNQFCDFIHVKDVARGLIMAFQHPHLENGVVIDIGSGTAVTIQELANIVSNKQTYGPRRPNDVAGSLANTCRAKVFLHFEARVPFVSSVRSLLKAPLSQFLDQSWHNQRKRNTVLVSDFVSGKKLNMVHMKEIKNVQAIEFSPEQRNNWARNVLIGHGRALGKLNEFSDLVLSGIVNTAEFIPSLFDFFNRVFIYRTGGASSCAEARSWANGRAAHLSSFQCIDRPNVGAEFGGALQHVVENYEAKLGNRIIFSASHLTAHRRIHKILGLIASSKPSGCYKAIHGAFSSVNFSISDYRSSAVNAKLRLNVSENRPMGKWSSIRNITWPTSGKACINGVVKTRKELILTRPLDFFVAIYNDLSRTYQPEEGHYVERLADMIFSGMEEENDLQSS
jgi:nucleoside-diphosphate-sugar epimerase